MSQNVSVSKHRDPLCAVIYPPNPLCWLVDNGMQLNLLLIRVLMCVIKYIAMSQLENTGAIHHFNWYPPRATWAHLIPSVFPKWSLLVEASEWEWSLFYWCTHIDFMACACSAWLYISGFVHFASYGTFEKSNAAPHYKSHTCPMIPVLSVYWMLMCQWMQMQSTACILFKQSHLISYSWVRPGLSSEAKLG